MKTCEGGVGLETQWLERCRTEHNLNKRKQIKPYAFGSVRKTAERRQDAHIRNMHIHVRQ